MKKIIYTAVGLTLPLFVFSQANNTTSADTTKKPSAPVISAVQAIASKTTLTPPQTAKPVSTAAMLQAGGKPTVVAPNQSKQPASAVELIQQTHQQDPAAASGQPH